MDGEVVFVAAYALALLALAGGLHRLGRINTDPWASRALSGYRAQMPAEPPTHPSWPHREAGRLHTAIGAVAAAASLLLCMGEAVRHHTAAEVLVLLVVAVPAAVTCATLLRRLR